MRGRMKMTEKSVMSFPSNSHKSRETQKEQKKIAKVVTGKVLTRKKSFTKRIIETFVGEDINDVGHYVVYDVLIPAARSTLNELFHGSIDMIFGEVKRSAGIRRGQGQGNGYFSYNKISDDRRNSRRDISNRSRARHDFDEIILDSKAEADEVIDRLTDQISQYDQATVSDLYDLVGIRGNFTDDKYGWVNLSSARAVRARGGGYVLDLPRPILLD